MACPVCRPLTPPSSAASPCTSSSARCVPRIAELCSLPHVFCCCCLHKLIKAVYIHDLSDIAESLLAVVLPKFIRTLRACPRWHVLKLNIADMGSSDMIVDDYAGHELLNRSTRKPPSKLVVSALPNASHCSSDHVRLQCLRLCAA